MLTVGVLYYVQVNTMVAVAVSPRDTACLEAAIEALAALLTRVRFPLLRSD